MDPFAKYFGWKLQSDGTYFVQNHEDTIKSRNIEEKLKFERKFLKGTKHSTIIKNWSLQKIKRNFLECGIVVRSATQDYLDA